MPPRGPLLSLAGTGHPAAFGAVGPVGRPATGCLAVTPRSAALVLALDLSRAAEKKRLCLYLSLFHTSHRVTANGREKRSSSSSKK